MSRTIMCSKDNLEKNLSDKIYIVTVQPPVLDLKLLLN